MANDAGRRAHCHRTTDFYVINGRKVLLTVSYVRVRKKTYVSHICAHTLTTRRREKNKIRSQGDSEGVARASRLLRVTHVDDECQRLSGVVFNQLLLVGSEKLRVLYVLQQKVTPLQRFYVSFLLLLVLLFLIAVAIEKGGAFADVRDGVEEKLHRGLLGVGGRV